LSLVTCHSSLAFVIVFEPHDIVLAQVIAELNLDEYEGVIRSVAETVIGLWRDVYVFACIESQLTVSADDIGRAGDDDPVFAAPCMTLEAQARARFNFKPLDLIAVALFQDFVTTPWPIIRFSQSWSSPL
jgi:hypothetical protein